MVKKEPIAVEKSLNEDDLAELTGLKDTSYDTNCKPLDI